MKKMIESKYGLLIFSLFSGLAYFILIMLLISEVRYSYLLGIFFFPAIICGVAIYLVKIIKACIENDEFAKLKKLVIFHIVLMIFALIYALITIIAKTGILI